MAVVDVELLWFRLCSFPSHCLAALEVDGGGGIPKMGEASGGLAKPVLLDVVVAAEVVLSCSFLLARVEDMPSPAPLRAASCLACAAAAA